MKLILTIASVVLSTTCLKAQLQLEDSIRLKMQQATGDSMLYALSHQAYSHFEELNNDSAYKYVSQCISLAERNDKELALAIALARRGYQQTSLAKFSEAFADLVRGISIAGDPVNVDIGWIPNITGTPETERIRVLAICHHMYALLMGRTGNVQDQNRHFHIARDYATRISNAGRIFLANMNFARIFSDLNNIDSARYYIDEALNILQSTDSSFQYSDKKYLGHIYATLGDIYQKSGDEVNARNSYYQGLKTSADQGNISAQVRAAYRLTQYYLHRKQPDSALFYAKLAKDLIGKLGLVIGTEINPGNIYEHVYRSYQIQNNPDSTLLYANLTLKLKDSLYRLYIAGMTQVQVLGFKEQQRLQELENEKQLYRSRVRLYTLLGGLAIFLIIAMILYRNNRQKNKSNKVLAKTLADLKSTQAQLVHSEKMASLGELTAGIAHEIQNPLNFVNNFSEVSNELADEMIEALNQNKGEEAIAIATDIKQNLEKVVHHGKRADGIVKGMLQHSRSSSHTKELTDINRLCEEYLRLAYHGLRARDKSFNASMQSDLDESLPNVKVIPEDIGRVILNLITNAFYAASDKKKTALGGYEPKVTVKTSRLENRIAISVSDNGTGIPANVMDKIFQPFFTTKPTGEGTGLGLSLSYDIITKGHQGELKVETKTGEGTTFTIILPIK